MNVRYTTLHYNIAVNGCDVERFLSSFFRRSHSYSSCIIVKDETGRSYFCGMELLINIYSRFYRKKNILRKALKENFAAISC